LVVGYTAYARRFGTGYESNTFQHFIHSLKGIKLELGECEKGPPTDVDLRKADASETVIRLNKGSLVSALFGNTDKEFYVFVRSITNGGWHVIKKPKTDYKGLTKIWLTELRTGLSGTVFLVAGTEDARSTRLSDGQILQALPSHLKYTDLRKVVVD